MPEKKAAAKKEKKRRMEERPGDEGRLREPPSGRRGEQVAVQKSLFEVFGSTGLDPDPERRAKILKRAKRVSRSKKRRRKRRRKRRKKKKKKKKGSPSGRKSSSTFVFQLFKFKD